MSKVRRVHPLSDGILFSDTNISGLNWKWKNFTPAEFSSKNNGEFYWHTRTFDAIQKARETIGKPLVINSAHRDWLHNAAIGGAPRSAHLYIALDVSTRGHSRGEVYHALLDAGFTSFGFYRHFIHVDLRPGRRWYGSIEARRIWEPILNMETPELQL